MSKKRETIIVSPLTKKRLKALKYNEHESYDHVISTLLNVKLDSGPIKYNISNNKCNIDVIVDWDAEMAKIIYLKKDESYLLFPPADIYTDNTMEWETFKKQVLENKEGILNICAILDPSETYPYGPYLQIHRYWT